MMERVTKKQMVIYFVATCTIQVDSNIFMNLGMGKNKPSAIIMLTLYYQDLMTTQLQLSSSRSRTIFSAPTAYSIPHRHPPAVWMLTAC